MNRPKLLIADDYASMLERLSTVLRARFEIVGTVTNGNLLIEEVIRTQPDVVVTDLSMHETNGLEAIRRLKLLRPEIRIVIVTMHADREIVAEALRSGASGFVLKLVANKDLPTAIDWALEGRVYVTPAIATVGM
ncbi:MAG: response regulator transcription factor [Acidobacteriota bacterium]